MPHGGRACTRQQHRCIYTWQLQGDGLALLLCFLAGLEQFLPIALKWLPQLLVGKLAQGWPGPCVQCSLPSLLKRAFLLISSFPAYHCPDPNLATCEQPGGRAIC